MSKPIVFISTHKIKPGKLEGFQERNREVARLIQSEKPGTVAFHAYVNEEGTEVSIVHVFPDAEAMEAHMEGVGERARDAADFLEFHRLEVYGRPTEKVLETMKQAPDSGVTFRIKPEPLSGYLRLESC
jgi:quinol monooxygenase YgiN